MSKDFNNQRDLLIAIREGKIPSERSGEYWSDAEKGELRRLFMEGVGISQIALILQRSENAVVQQLIVLSLLTPPGSSRGLKKNEPKCRCPECDGKNCPYYREGYCRTRNV